MGRHLAAALAQEHGVTRLNRSATGVADEVIHDFAQPLAFGRLPERIDLVIHAAGLVGQEASASPSCWRVNVEGTSELADYAVRAGAKGFVLFSTGGVYAPSSGKLTEQSVVSPSDGYSKSKLAAEGVVLRRSDSLDVKVLRLFFPYGPSQAGRLVPKLIDRIAHGLPVVLQNESGQPLVTPIYIDDLVEYLRRLVAIPGSVLANVAGGEAVSIRRLGEMIGTALGRGVSFTVEGTGSVCNWWGDNGFLSEITGYSPRHSLSTGLAKVVRQ